MFYVLPDSLLPKQDPSEIPQQRKTLTVIKCDSTLIYFAPIFLSPIISDDSALLALVYLPELNPTALQSAGQIEKRSVIKSFLNDTYDDHISNLQ